MPGLDNEILRGELAQVALEDIVAAIGRERITGRLLLSQGFRIVSVYFECGDLVHVGGDSDAALDELLCAFAWTSGDFGLELEAEAPARTERVGSAELILQGMRLRDGWDSMRNNLPLPDAVLWLPTVGHRGHGSISLSGVEARVLEIGPIATPDVIQWAPGLPKTRSGKIMRRILEKIAANDVGDLGDTSTLADPTVVENLVTNRNV